MVVSADKVRLEEMNRRAYEADIRFGFILTTDISNQPNGLRPLSLQIFNRFKSHDYGRWRTVDYGRWRTLDNGPRPIPIRRRPASIDGQSIKQPLTLCEWAVINNPIFAQNLPATKCNRHELFDQIYSRHSTRGG